jgi:diguanylate cyclase
MRFHAANSFAHKMTMLALLASSVASATLMAVFVAYDSVNAYTQRENRLATLANIVGQNSAAALMFDDRPAAIEVLQALQAEGSVVSACLYGPSGSLFAEYRRSTGLHDCPAQLAAGKSPARGYADAVQTVQREGDFAGTLVLRSDLREIEARWRHMLEIALLPLVVALVVGGIAGSLLQRKFSKPVRELAAAMREVTERHNFGARVAPRGADEIAQLGDGFNTMIAELEKRASEKAAFEVQLRRQALNDELTGLPNRRLLADRLRHALDVAQRAGHQVALLYIDLDGFKLVNDSLGHAIGDRLLCQVAERLRSRVRRSDTLARLGGDEFAVVLSGLSARREAERVAQDLLDILKPHFQVANHEISIGASIGMSLFPDNGATPALLLQQADSAMYAAKRAGRDRMAAFSDEMGTAIRERLNLEVQLRNALARDQIRVYFQPEFDLHSRRLVRFEALARWTHPALGTISPARFIPVAEEMGLISTLGLYVMDLACREAVRWQSLAGHPVAVAVNVSSLQLMRDSFEDEVADVLRATGLDPHLLQIELTESVMVDGARRAAEGMSRLSTMGVSLAIDDFGTGYSCLSYLPQLPFDALKIDRSFVSELGSKPEVEAMVHALITLAHNLGMRVIAEGVETERQLQRITELGCNEAQGYLLGRPTPDAAACIRAQRDAEPWGGARSAEIPAGGEQAQAIAESR